MTPQKVIDNLNCRIKQIDDLLKNMSDSEKRRFEKRLLKEKETLVACKKIVEKQIPKKPKLTIIPLRFESVGEIEGKYYYCPHCFENERFEHWYNYALTVGQELCLKCGQKLDWSEMKNDQL